MSDVIAMETLKTIAYIRTDFPEKFGIPRQSGLVKTYGEVHFLPEYADVSTVRGLEAYSHLWLIWGFSANAGRNWHPTVRPPRLGGNKRVGVFATRSPFRPNPIGLSCVELVRVDVSKDDGPVLIVSGADMLDGTPIYDIKPYLPYVDCHPKALGSFSQEKKDYHLDVHISDAMRAYVCDEDWECLKDILSHDPRPAYQEDPDRIYGMTYKQMQIRFKVDGNVLEIVDIK